MRISQKKLEIKNKIIVIVGPTASGKSDLAVKIAKKLNGEIISADSRQVYKGLDIGAGKVPRDKTTNHKLQITNYSYRDIPHHLLDIASPKRIFTVAQYQKLARKKINKIWGRSKLPILCGGTGFYINAVVDGLSIPEVKPNHKLRRELEKKTTEELFQILKNRDPRRANSIDRQNPRRLIRAIEIAKKLGRVPKIKKTPLKCSVLFLGIEKNRAELKNLISKRLKRRIKAGMLKEIKNLHKNGVSWKRMEELGLEYRYGARYTQGKILYQEFIDALTKEICRYAKRQMTWFRKDKRIHWIAKTNEAITAAKTFLQR